MTSFEEQLHTSAQTVSLSQQEREEMRAYLAEYQSHMPRRGIGAVEASHGLKSGFGVRNLFGFARARGMAWTMAGLLLMTTSGITYAAESAVPGDILHGLKVNVNEEVVRAFSFGAEARMLWEARRAERRLEEAGKLAATGALTPERERQVAEQFERHIERVSEQTAVLGADDPARADDVNNLLENAFSAHEAILVSLAIEEQLSAESVKALASRVRGVAREFRRVQSQTEEVLAVAGEALEEEDEQSTFSELPVYDQRIMVQRMREGAEKSLRTAENRVTRMSLISDRDLSTSKARLTEIRAVHEQARANYTAGELELSYARYKAVRSVSDRLTRFLDAQRNLAIDALSLDLAEELLFAQGTTEEGVSQIATLVFDTLDEKKATVEESISALSMEEVLGELAESDRAEVESLLKRARALVVRATLAEQTDDTDEAARFYVHAEEVLEDVRTILLSPRSTDESSEEHDRKESDEHDRSDEEGVELDEKPENQHATGTVSITQVFKDGIHTLQGVLDDVCEVEATVSSEESGLVVRLTRTETEEDTDACERANPGEFTATIEAPQNDALTEVYVDEVEVPHRVVTYDDMKTNDSDIIPEDDKEKQSSAPLRGYRATNELVNRMIDDLKNAL